MFKSMIDLVNTVPCRNDLSLDSSYIISVFAPQWLYTSKRFRTSSCVLYDLVKNEDGVLPFSSPTR